VRRNNYFRFSKSEIRTITIKGWYIMGWKFGKNFGFNWSWKRAFGIAAFRQRLARKTGVPTTRSGLNQKVGRSIINGIMSIFKR
jgi:hypothetical protein